MITDPVADLLTRIRNASSASLEEITSPHSTLRVAILTILKKEGYIDDFEILEDETKRKSLLVRLAYSYTAGQGKASRIRNIERISRPGRRVYATHKNIPRPLRGMGTVIISTSGGLTTGREAQKRGLGGEILCKIW